jgi:hypothetical protein
MGKYNRSIRGRKSLSLTRKSLRHKRKTSGRKRKTSGRKRKTSGRKRKTSGRKRKTSGRKRKTSGRKNLRGGMFSSAMGAAKHAFGLGGAAVPSGMNPDGAALAAAAAAAPTHSDEDKADIEREIARRVELQGPRSSDLLAGQKIMHCRNRDTCQGITRVFQYNPRSHSSQFNKDWKCDKNHTASADSSGFKWSKTPGSQDKRIIRCVGSGCNNENKEFSAENITPGDWVCTVCGKDLDGHS